MTPIVATRAGKPGMEPVHSFPVVMTVYQIITPARLSAAYTPAPISYKTIMNKKTSGLTLIELLVTVAVVMVLLVLGVPQFRTITASNRLTTSINLLQGDLAFARTEAIKRGMPVTISSAATNWATGGWTTAVTISGADTDLRISPPLTNMQQLTSTETEITFNADGRLDGGGTVRFTLCDDRSGDIGKQVDIRATGQTDLTTKIDCP